ncbi:alpha/beta fold hydrolase [Tautonia plasticadhaerens]|uniref:Phospholipase YtpA n=1 Tax=Tautonia plasticadhaerens TaxID=2527974 RepID=A0A518GYP5_9BACT|nr:alpha/beta fold hydrolase [Tautonia plasticadhaerens]QDV33673.1 Phospholipase YtpA [Tautonia plasticadhaerens]
MPENFARRFEASDGYPLHVLSWPTPGPPRAVAVILHGVQSHAGWYHHLGRTLAGGGIEAHFPDRRGSGSNESQRGHCPSSRRLVKDVLELTRDLKASRPATPVILGGISWGGKVAVVSAAKGPESIDGVALICPGLQPRVGVPITEKLRIAAGFFLFRSKPIFRIPLADPALFTADPEAQRFIAEDELGLRRASAGLLAASMFLDRAARRAPGRVNQPCLLMLAGRDRIVDNDRTRAYFSRIASADTQEVEYPEAHHTLEFEADPGRYARDLIGWIEARWPVPDAATSPPP